MAHQGTGQDMNKPQNSANDHTSLGDRVGKILRDFLHNARFTLYRPGTNWRTIYAKLTLFFGTPCLCVLKRKEPS